MPSASARLGRWLKPAGTIALYVFVFYWTDARAILGRLRAVDLSPLVAGILIYAAGQAVSAFKWRLLIAPLELAVSYTAPARFLLHRHVLQPVSADNRRRRRGESRAACARDARAGPRDDVRVHGAEHGALRAAADRDGRIPRRAAGSTVRPPARGADGAARRRLRGRQRRPAESVGLSPRGSDHRGVAAGADAAARAVALRRDHAVQARGADAASRRFCSRSPFKRS